MSCNSKKTDKPEKSLEMKLLFLLVFTGGLLAEINIFIGHKFILNVLSDAETLPNLTKIIIGNFWLWRIVFWGVLAAYLVFFFTKSNRVACSLSAFIIILFYYSFFILFEIALILPFIPVTSSM